MYVSTKLPSMLVLARLELVTCGDDLFRRCLITRLCNGGCHLTS